MTDFKPTHGHYKGGLYRVLQRGRRVNDLTPVVIYQDEDGEVWVRPEDDFDVELRPGLHRFELIKDDGGLELANED